jgi:glucan phosphoethanolaminetransferase (alkaline phosphatase superfamily)
LGDIVYKTLIRFVLILLSLWFGKNLFDGKFFWIISVLAIYFFVFHPAYLSYKKFFEDNKNVITNSLCSSCKHFNESAVLCTKYDKHPTDNFIPCEGTAWEPR